MEKEKEKKRLASGGGGDGHRYVVSKEIFLYFFRLLSSSCSPSLTSARSKNTRG